MGSTCASIVSRKRWIAGSSPAMTILVLTPTVVTNDKPGHALLLLLLRRWRAGGGSSTRSRRRAGGGTGSRRRAFGRRDARFHGGGSSRGGGSGGFGRGLHLFGVARRRHDRDQGLIEAADHAHVRRQRDLVGRASCRERV